MFAVVAFFLFHPFIIGLGYRINDYRFGNNLKAGQTRASIEGSANRLGAFLLAPRCGNELYVRFRDISGIYGSSGTEYNLTFDADSRLVTWRTESWMSYL
jgi:hypothetical protein